jgi:proteic killer suppression protein
MPIRSWKSEQARAVFEGCDPGKGFPADLVSVTRRRLQAIHAAASLDDLRAFRGNRLHELVGDRKGQWSVSVNDQFRICFTWSDGSADNIEFVDYH